VRSTPLSLFFVLVAIICLILAGLYAFGVLQIFVTDPHSPHHYTHTILFAVLAVVSLVIANFTRPRTV
jgi:membrane protein YdbS with pleckstrin-like domain